MSYTIIRNYITDQEAESLIPYLNSILPAKPGLERNVARFGVTKSYSSNRVSTDIPPALQYLCNKLIDDGYEKEIAHVTVNRYDKGQSIPWHTDSKEAGEIITIISLNSDVTILFKDLKNKIKEVPLPKNSLLQFDGDTRYKDKHSLKPVDDLRYSIVFRKQ